MGWFLKIIQIADAYSAEGLSRFGVGESAELHLIKLQDALNLKRRG